jgi:hypothetical protein
MAGVVKTALSSAAAIHMGFFNITDCFQKFRTRRKQVATAAIACVFCARATGIHAAGPG